MIRKENFLNALAQLNEIFKKYDLNTLVESNNGTIEEINEFKIHMLLMGGFSAGKSALINAVLHRELLVEEQGEETAIATELLYDKDEYVEAFSNDGIERYAIEELTLINPDKFSFLRVHVTSDFLQAISDYIIVDMPGLDSKVEKHNKAIIQYIGKGNAYLLCVDCEDGELKPSRANFIREIKQYKNSLALAITKCDKRPDTIVDSVKEQIQGTAENIFQEGICTYKVSKFDDDIETKMKGIVDSFDVQDLYEQAFFNSISENINFCIMALQNVKKTNGFDEEEFTREIKEYEKIKSSLEKQLQKEKIKLSQKMEYTVKPNILSEVENVLLNNIQVLTSSALTGGDSFSKTVNDLIRPVLLSATKKYTEESFAQFVDELDIPSVYDEDDINEIAERKKMKYDQFSEKLSTIAGQHKDSDKTYKIAITSLAVLTNVIAPWVEILIIFLPEILSLFGGIIKKSQENGVKNKISGEIIPEIINKLDDSMSETLSVMKDELICELQEKYDMQISAKIESMEKVQDEMTNKKNEYEFFMSDIDNDIDILLNILARMEGRQKWI